MDQIVLVDDGSSPDHAARLETLAIAHREIELHRFAESRGVAAARNLAMDHARGEYILFLDDDDLIHPRLCEEGLAVLDGRRDADAVVFLYQCFQTLDECFQTATDGAQTHLIGPWSDCEALGSHSRTRLASSNPVPAGFLERRPISSFLRFLIPVNSCLVRRASIGGCRFPESLRQGEDTYFWISLAAQGCRFLADSRSYAYVRRHSANTTRSRSRYELEIQGCYESLLATGLLRDPDDVLLAHLKLLLFKLARRRRGWAPNLWHVLSAPRPLTRRVRILARQP